MTGNIQYLRTDRAIQSALLSLLDKKPFDKITVQDILDETPVSRATFYKHFRDKHEIAERIQEDVMHAHAELRRALAGSTLEGAPALVERFVLRCRDTSRLLMKIQTPRVNLTEALMEEGRKFYLETASGPTAKLEAQIYAAATAAVAVSLLDDTEEHTADQLFHAILSAALGMVGLEDAPDVRELITKKREQLKK